MWGWCPLWFVFPIKHALPLPTSMYCIITLQFMVMNFFLTQMCLIFSVCIPAYNVSHSSKWQTASFAWKRSWSPPNLTCKEPTGPRSNPDTESIAVYSGSVPSFVTFRWSSNLKVSTCVKTTSWASASALCVIQDHATHEWGIVGLTFCACGWTVWTACKQYLLWQNSNGSVYWNERTGMTWEQYVSV